MSEPSDSFETFLEHLAPASQPTPPPVRNPAGAGSLKGPAPFFTFPPAQDAFAVIQQKYGTLHDAMPQLVHFALLNCILGRYEESPV
jgi:hypothetical protein